MKFQNEHFEQYVKDYSTLRTQSLYRESVVKNLEIEDSVITANVFGSSLYKVTIRYNEKKISSCKCTCPYDMGGICKHIVHVLVRADEKMAISEQEEFDSDLVEGDQFIFQNKRLTEISNTDIMRHSSTSGYNNAMNKRVAWSLLKVKIDEVETSVSLDYYHNHAVKIFQDGADLVLECGCGSNKSKLCEHQTISLVKTLENEGVLLFFNPKMRNEAFKQQAIAIGIENEPNLDDYFELEYSHYRVQVKRKINAFALDQATKKEIKASLLPLPFNPDDQVQQTNFNRSSFVVVKYADYTKKLQFKYMDAALSKEGKIKNPMASKSALDELFLHAEPLKINFLAALTKFDHEYRSTKEFKDLTTNEFQAELMAIKHVISNPLDLQFYFHNTKTSDNLTSSSLDPIAINESPVSLELEVKEKGSFYEISCKVAFLNKRVDSERVKIFADCFIHYGDELILVSNFTYLRTLRYFKKYKHKILIHTSKLEEFRTEFLNELESQVKISYSFIKKASEQLIQKEGLDTIQQRIIYLSDSENYVLITPTIQYGSVEIPVRSKRELYTHDLNGNLVQIERNTAEEYRFMREIEGTHPDFQHQEQTDYFYLHKQEFLDQEWFLDVFENWAAQGIEVLGFNSIKNNRLNSNKMKVSMTINRGIDWFDVAAKVSFGNQSIGLKEIQKSIANRTKYIKLGDGTMGVLPDEWVQKFSHFFRSGDLHDNQIRAHKTNFTLIETLFDDAELPETIQVELAEYRSKINAFNEIAQVNVPKKLNATLRDYQKEGLNWLNFLDEFGFGGCLADDMGLGKTIQMIAYILIQKEKGRKEANLVVVPTSLLFNWQAEVKKFAPSLKIKVVYGINRDKKNSDFDQYDIVLTSYGTLISDIVELKNYTFNCILLDESQAIKNPDSKRYKSVRLLQSRQKIVLTGTPIENNTFDLYAQLSFAIPGLFGSAKRFADDYATPIDKFQDSRRAKELQQKIKPFILRRTKKQVAQELPEKTEMVIYCEMGVEQRNVYDTYKKEFQQFLTSKTDDELRNSSMHVLQGLTKLRQICNSPVLLSDEEFYGDSSAKIDELMEQIRSKSSEHKMLVFSQFVGMLDLIAAELNKEGIPYNYLTGKTKKRQEEVERFQQEDESRVFLISLKAGGTGLNLTEADYVFIVDPWWNPAVENQAIDRCYRIGQKKNVVAIRLICPDTIEDKIMQLQATKRELAEELIVTDTHMSKSLSKMDLLGLV